MMDAPIEMQDPHFLPAHMMAARTEASLQAHVQEDIRRFGAVGLEIRDVKETMSKGFDKMEKKHDDISRDVNDLGKKLTYLLGGIITFIEVLKWGLEYAPKLIQHSAGG